MLTDCINNIRMFYAICVTMNFESLSLVVEIISGNKLLKFIPTINTQR